MLTKNRVQQYLLSSTSTRGANSSTRLTLSDKIRNNKGSDQAIRLGFNNNTIYAKSRSYSPHHRTNPNDFKSTIKLSAIYEKPRSFAPYHRDFHTKRLTESRAVGAHKYSIPPYSATHLKRFYSTNGCNYYNNWMHKLLNGVGLSIFATMSGFVAWMLIKEFQGDEHEIVGNPIKDIKAYPAILDKKEFLNYKTDRKQGHHTGYYLIHIETGRVFYTKKGDGKEGLKREYGISNLLNGLIDDQPKNYLLHEKTEDGKAIYTTLSEVAPNSMDLKQFFQQKDWRDKLSKKQVIGFEVALANDLIFGKQSDMKLENYIIIEHEDAFYIATIDHERADKKIFLTGGPKVFDPANDMKQLLGNILDFQPKDDFNSVPWDGASEIYNFLHEHTEEFLSQEALMDYYHEFAQLDGEKITQIFEQLHESGVLNEEECLEGTKYLLSKQNDVQLALSHMNRVEKSALSPV